MAGTFYISALVAPENARVLQHAPRQYAYLSHLRAPRAPYGSRTTAVHSQTLLRTPTAMKKFASYLLMGAMAIAMTFAVACESAENAGNEAKKKMDDAANKVEESASDAMDKAGEMADDVKEGAENAAKDVKEGAENAADKVKEGAENAADKVKEGAKDAKDAVTGHDGGH